MARTRTCEICGDVVHEPITAKCGHKAWLCETCIDDCPGASMQCVACEDKNGPTMGDDKGIDEEWRREIAMEAGMLHGVDAYNEVMGCDVEDPDAY